MSNSVNITNNNSTINVTISSTPNNVTVTQTPEDNRIVEVRTLGPRGATGLSGIAGPSGSIDTGSLVTTSSFNSHTASFDTFSSSVAIELNNIDVDVSHLVTTQSFNSYTSSNDTHVSTLQTKASQSAQRNETNVFTSLQTFNGSFEGQGYGFISGSLHAAEGWGGVRKTDTEGFDSLRGIPMAFTCQSTTASSKIPFSYGDGSATIAAVVGARMPFNGEIVAITSTVNKMTGGTYIVSPYVNNILNTNGRVTVLSVPVNGDGNASKFMSNGSTVLFNAGDDIQFKFEAAPTVMIQATIVFFVRFFL